MSTSFFGGAFFDGEFFHSGGDSPPLTVTTKTGGKGDNEKGKKKSIFKPTGITYNDAPKKKQIADAEVRKSIDERIAETEEMLAAIKKISAEAERTEAVKYQPIEKMSLSAIDAEIHALMKKANRKREDEELIMILMAISQVS